MYALLFVSVCSQSTVLFTPRCCRTPIQFAFICIYFDYYLVSMLLFSKVKSELIYSFQFITTTSVYSICMSEKTSRIPTRPNPNYYSIFSFGGRWGWCKQPIATMQLFSAGWTATVFCQCPGTSHHSTPPEALWSHAPRGQNSADGTRGT